MKAKGQSPQIEIEILDISSQHSSPQMGFPPHSLPEFPTSTSLQIQLAPPPVKPTNMGNVMKIVSGLPGVVEGDDFWMKAARYLLTSKGARKMLVHGEMNEDMKEKFLRAEVENFNK